MNATTDTPPRSSTHSRVRKFRYADDDHWALFLANAQSRGTTGSAILVKAVDDFNDQCALEDAGAEPTT